MQLSWKMGQSLILLCILGSKEVIPAAVTGAGKGPSLPLLCPEGMSLSLLASLALPSNDGATFGVKTLKFKEIYEHVCVYMLSGSVMSNSLQCHEL